ncbi:hypothetical protein [Roseovarius sp. 2305UL8-3]|uniref:hypothetical protein n=1 Tax=Roseovarius conchicola TaxID=3121636 RepID=UPI0035287F71
MTATRIIDGLEALDLKGEDAAAAARLGFLEWVFAMPGAATPQDAVDALKVPEAQNPGSAAAQAFVDFLHQATSPVTRPRSRGGRARRLH